MSCEVVKIPLMCNLSGNRISYPARGSFCTHFQCFDLHNFLKFISMSNYPKWICIFCKKPCYKFKVDILLTTLIQEYQRQ